MKTLHDGVSRCDSSSSEPKEKERKKLKKKNYVTLRARKDVSLSYSVIRTFTFILLLPSDLIRTVEGEDYNITCLRSVNDTNATNSFNFSWHRSGEDDAISNAKLLEILDIKRNSSGNYSCTATNNTANLVRNITVIVYCKYISKFLNWV